MQTYLDKIACVDWRLPKIKSVIYLWTMWMNAVNEPSDRHVGNIGSCRKFYGLLLLFRRKETAFWCFLCWFLNCSPASHSTMSSIVQVTVTMKTSQFIVSNGQYNHHCDFHVVLTCPPKCTHRHRRHYHYHHRQLHGSTWQKWQL